jgi:FtsZ-interacting cell division protein ZipA
MRTGLVLIAALALASLVQECGGGPANNTNNTKSANTATDNSNSNNSSASTNMNTNAKTTSNNEQKQPNPAPSPANEKANGNTNSNGNAQQPASQRKIPSYGELGNDAPPAQHTPKKPEPKSSPR